MSAARPLRVEWYKHGGMVRYYRKFHGSGLHWPSWLLVSGLVWARFAAIFLRVALHKCYRRA